MTPIIWERTSIREDTHKVGSEAAGNMKVSDDTEMIYSLTYKKVEI